MKSLKIPMLLLLAFLMFISLGVSCKKQEAQKAGETSLEITVKMNGSPAKDINVDLWTQEAPEGPPDAGSQKTDKKGIARFTLKPGEYRVGFNPETYPDGIPYQMPISVTVNQGKNQKTIELGSEYTEADLEKEIENLTRKYPTTMKVLVEPLIDQTEMALTDPKVKETGFNTISFNMDIVERDGEISYSLLGIKDEQTAFNKLASLIVQAKQDGYAVWIACNAFVEMGASPKIKNIDEWIEKAAQKSVELAQSLEEYKVEYYTANNELDRVFTEQKTKQLNQISSSLENEVAGHVRRFQELAHPEIKKCFQGEIVSKATINSRSIFEATAYATDILGADAGPPPMDETYYRREIEDLYNLAASISQKHNIPWLNAEYWLVSEGPGGKVEENPEKTAVQYECANIAFDAYKKTKPQGIGFAWDFHIAFEAEPDGEKTRQALQGFFEEID